MMEILDELIKDKIIQLPDEAKVLLEESQLANSSKYAFNRYANIFSVLLTKGELSYDDYTSIRDEYFERNPHLDLFEKAPRTFGQTWGEDWLRQQKNEYLEEPPRNKGYKAEFDLWLPLIGAENGIRIEVKSSRVADKNQKCPLVERAYKRPRGSEEEVKNKIKNEYSFEMNFQQLKPEYCDVFVWIAVWLDDIDIWAIPSEKIKMRPKNAKRRNRNTSIVLEDGTIYMGTQHAGGKGGNVPEGQIYVTNNHFFDLDCYKVTLDNLIDKIKSHGNLD